MLRLNKITKTAAYLFITVFISLLSSIVGYADWYQDNAGWKFDQGGTALTDTWKELDGLWYHFNETGYMDTGWYFDTHSQNRYFLGADGAMLSGTQVMDGQYFSFKSSGEFMGSIPIHIEGLDDSLLEAAIRQTDAYWAETEYGLSLVNAERMSHGLNPLVLDKDLCNIANYRSAYMDQTGFYEHYRDGIDLSNTASSAYYGKNTGVGENVYNNYSLSGEAINFSVQNSVKRGFNYYLQSPGHYENMMEPSYCKIGIGVYCNASNTRRFFTQIFQ